MDISGKNRSVYLDVVRVLACLMVIIMHAPMANEMASHHGPFLVAVNYITSPCVCLFFMVSGALLLPVRDNVITFKFLKKRLDRILLPTLFFSIFYILLNISGLSGSWVKSVLSIPLARQGHGILWFMYTLVGLYLLVPILSSWLRVASKSELKMYIMLWFVTLCYPFLKAYLYIDSSDTGVLYYFSGYVGYFLLGYYLHRYPVSLRWLLPISVCILPLPLLLRKWDFGIDLNSAFSYLSAPIAILTATWFTVCQNMLISIWGGPQEG